MIYPKRPPRNVFEEFSFFSASATRAKAFCSFSFIFQNLFQFYSNFSNVKTSDEISTQMFQEGDTQRIFANLWITQQWWNTNVIYVFFFTKDYHSLWLRVRSLFRVSLSNDKIKYVQRDFVEGWVGLLRLGTVERPSRPSLQKGLSSSFFLSKCNRTKIEFASPLSCCYCQECSHYSCKLKARVLRR